MQQIGNIHQSEDPARTPEIPTWGCMRMNPAIPQGLNIDPVGATLRGKIRQGIADKSGGENLGNPPGIVTVRPAMSVTVCIATVAPRVTLITLKVEHKMIIAPNVNLLRCIFI
jgi:hypothetical protein